MTAPTPLLDQASDLRRDAAERVPGRLAELIDRRVAQLLRLDSDANPPGDAAADAAGEEPLDDAEQVVIDLVEQFLIDVHGITDAGFARLNEHYTSEEQVAIMFHLALADGFAKLRKVDGTTTARSKGTEP